LQKRDIYLFCQHARYEKAAMTHHKREVFPISFLNAEDRTGTGHSSFKTEPYSTPAKTDYRKGPLRNVPLFAELSDESICRLEKQATRLNFAKGQEIISRADTSRDVFLLLAGQARVTFFSSGGKAVAFRKIDPGDLFGEFAAIDGQGRSATVEATRHSTALCIGWQLFWELMQSDRAFTAAVMLHLVGLLRSMTARIVEFSTLGVKNRIHCELLRMVKKALAETGRSELNPAPTHSDLAARISTHREAVSRELSRLTKLGIIERKGRSITIKDMESLERMVEEAGAE
jgi:CRP/FNR family cyclic AMP-dependent transcriptional regulator